MLSKKNFFVFFALLLTLSTIKPTNSYAEDVNISSTPEAVITKTQELRILKELRPSIQKQQEEMRKKIEEQKLKFKTEMEMKREEIRKEVEEKINEKKEMFQASREAFLNKMKLIKDENKQQILEKLDSMLKQVNTKHTTNMTEALNKLSNILDDMADKAADAKTNGADTTAFDETMVKARASIMDAEAKVSTQAAKEYIISISTEDALRSAVGETRKQLETDLQTTRDSVKSAKEAVRDVAKELIKIRHEVKKEPTISISPVISPTSE